MFHEILAWNESQEFRRETPHPPKRNKLIREKKALNYQPSLGAPICLLDRSPFFCPFALGKTVLWNQANRSLEDTPTRPLSDSHELLQLAKTSCCRCFGPFCETSETYWEVAGVSENGTLQVVPAGLPDYQNSNFGVPPLLSQTLVLKLGHNVKCVWKHR